LIKVDFDWDFTLNKYSLRAYTCNESLQPSILNHNVNQFKVGLDSLESDKGYFHGFISTGYGVQPS
jgi:hypothetical protein